MNNIYIAIISIILVLVIFTLINLYQESIKQSNIKCNLENFDLDKIQIIKREPEYQRLINKLIDEKRFIFTDEEIKILKNKFQVYNITDNDIQNISKIIMLNCKNNLDSMDKDNDNYKPTPEEQQDIYYNIMNNSEYNKIINNMNVDINDLYEPDCANTKFLKHNNQINYYYDLYGNNIQSDTKQYYANYYSTINSEDNRSCIPVKTIRTKKPDASNTDSLPITEKPYFLNLFDINPYDESYTNYIIPAQYKNDVLQTNIFNIDNERIINPYTIY